MNVEGLKSLFDWGTVILLFLTFAFGAGALITGNILGKVQEAKSRQFEKDLTEAKTKLGEQQERAANADARVQGLEKDAADAKTAEAKAEKELLLLKERIRNRHLTSEQQKTVAAKLKAFAGQKINLVTHGGDDEITGISKDVVAALGSPTGAQWSITTISGGSPTGNLGGILIEVEPNASESVRDAAVALASLFRAERLSVTGPQSPSSVRLYSGATIHGNLAPGDTSVITVTIAKKP